MPSRFELETLYVVESRVGLAAAADIVAVEAFVACVFALDVLTVRHVDEGERSCLDGHTRDAPLSLLSR